MAWTKEETDRVLTEIIQRSRQDAAFRRRCFENPGAAVKEIAGQDVPPGFKLRFVDNDRADLVVVLPDPIEQKGQATELSDDDLSAVSGGIVVQSSLTSYQVQFTYSTSLITGSCFAAGTPVLMADGSSLSIEAISLGAGVLAFDERERKVVTGTVTKLLRHEAEPIHRAVVDGLGTDLLLTPNHPFYSGGRWQAIRDLAMQAELYHFDPSLREASPRRLVALEPTGHRELVYNLEVESAHTYFVGGLLVHNGSIGSMK